MKIDKKELKWPDISGMDTIVVPLPAPTKPSVLDEVRATVALRDAVGVPDLIGMALEFRRWYRTPKGLCSYCFEPEKLVSSDNFMNKKPWAAIAIGLNSVLFCLPHEYEPEKGYAT